MPKITPDLLNDTLSLVQIARETALARGSQDQAERLKPVVDGLRSAVQTSQDQNNAKPVSKVMAQDDFQTLLAATSSQPANPIRDMSALERTQVVTAMQGGGMSDAEIARQVGMTREEVRMILSLNQSAGMGLEAQK
jgi:hypothetical protein